MQTSKTFHAKIVVIMANTRVALEVRLCAMQTLLGLSQSLGQEDTEEPIPGNFNERCHLVRC